MIATYAASYTAWSGLLLYTLRVQLRVTSRALETNAESLILEEHLLSLFVEFCTENHASARN